MTDASGLFYFYQMDEVKGNQPLGVGLHKIKGSTVN